MTKGADPRSPELEETKLEAASEEPLDRHQGTLGAAEEGGGSQQLPAQLAMRLSSSFGHDSREEAVTLSTYSFHNLTYSIPVPPRTRGRAESLRVLKGVSGEVQASEMLALVSGVRVRVGGVAGGSRICVNVIPCTE